MARVSTAGGGFGGGGTVIPSDSSHPDYVSVPDAELVFRGDYHRAGPDLVLTGHDGRHHVIPGYFAGDKHPALVAPNGAGLSAETVDLLAGSPTPAHYAQAQPAAPPDSIGKVEKIVGDVTVLRNGVSVALQVGDAVYKSDVIATGADASAGITFPDGTVLDLVANSRMALNEYSFAPNGTDNGALFTLVEGTFGFIAGQVAHDNHMSVVTPVATMGIRGTAGIVRHEFRANGGDLIYSFLVLDEVDIRHHGHHVGSYEVRDNRPESPTFGEILRFIEDSGYVTYIEPQGAGLPPLVTIEAITNSRQFQDRPILHDLADSYALFNPGGIHGPGSGDNPNQLFGPQFFEENNGLPFTFNFQGGGANGATPINFNFTIPVQPDVLPPPPPPPPVATSNIFIWDGGPGTYPTQNWSQPGVPNASNDIVEILSGTVTYPAGDNFIISELIIGPGATLDIVGGTLTVLNGIVDDGSIVVEGDPPTLKAGPTTIGSAGSFVATGSGDEIEFTGNVFNSGLLQAAAGGELLFDAAVVNEPGGTRKSAGIITSTGTGSIIDLNGDVFNFGTIGATHGGIIAFDGGTVVNEAAGADQVAGLMVSDGVGSAITFTDNTIDNFGVMLATHRGEITFDPSTLTNETGGIVEAKHHGIITFDDTDITNDSGGTIEAIGRGSRIIALGGSIDNFGTFLAVDRGTMWLKSADITNEVSGEFKVGDGGRLGFDNDDVTNDGKILAFGHDSRILARDGDLDNSGVVAAKDYGIIKFFNETVTNEDGAKFLATDWGRIGFDGGEIVNWTGAIIEAKDHGWIGFKDADVSNSGGSIQSAGWGSTIAFFDGTSLLNGGRVDAKYGGEISFDHATIHNLDGATIAAWDGGVICIDCSSVDNDRGAVIEARHFGTVSFFDAFIDNDRGAVIKSVGDGSVVDIGYSCVDNDGFIKAEWGGTVYVDHTVVDNIGGAIAAFGCGSTVELDDARIIGGTLVTGDPTSDRGGVIEVAGYGTSIFDGSDHHSVTVDGYVNVDSGANLELIGTIYDDGVINVDPEHDGGADLIIDGTVKLDGGGAVTLDGSGDEITGSGRGAELDNFDTISGAGRIGGSDDDPLALINEAGGEIKADLTGQTLTIHTGQAIINDGTLVACDGGKLLVEDVVEGCGKAVIEAGFLQFDTKSDTDVAFNNDHGYGELILGDAKDFSGQICGFGGNGAECPSLANTDEIDLLGIASNNIFFCESGDDAEITIMNSTHTKVLNTITLVDFNYLDLEKTGDGHGGTLIFDPPPAASPVSVNPVNDNFVFHPGMGADTIANFNPQSDTIELDNFPNIQNLQQLAALITSDAHGDALIALDHSDSIMLPGVSASYLQAHLQSLVHLG